MSSPPRISDRGLPFHLAVVEFIAESWSIEGLSPPLPAHPVVDATKKFLNLLTLTIDDVIALQAVYAPGRPLRLSPGMDVVVGSHRPPRGGPEIESYLQAFLSTMTSLSSPNTWADPYDSHLTFEWFHPFMDGNGRTGRTLWAWAMIHHGWDPFELPFLRWFYYRTLAAHNERVNAHAERSP